MYLLITKNGILLALRKLLTMESLLDQMDGLTLHSKEDYDSLKENHHCEDYGKSNTAEGSWERCINVDHDILYSLDLLKKYGIKFKIITPTKFKDFYDSTILEV